MTESENYRNDKIWFETLPKWQKWWFKLRIFSADAAKLGGPPGTKHSANELQTNGAKHSPWFSASRANDASGQVQHLSQPGHSTLRNFFIDYLEYRNFLHSTFLYVFEDYAILFSALTDSVLTPNSFTEGRFVRSKMPKIMKKPNVLSKSPN